MVNNGNFILLLTSSGHEWQFSIATDIWWLRMAILTFLLTSSGQEWQFHIATDMLVVKNGNFTLLLTSSGHQ